MSVNTIEVPRALRDTVDAYILENPTVEHGGFILGTPLRFDAFLPTPNASPNPNREYRPNDAWQAYATEYGKLIGADIVAHVHSHPNHSIPSGQDLKAGRYWFERMPYMLLIAPNPGNQSTTWWTLDRAAEVQSLLVTDAAVATASLLLQRRYGFASMGEVLLDLTGTIRATGDIAMCLLTHPDARQAYARLRAHGRATHTQKELVDVTGLSAARATTAADALRAAGLLKPIPEYRRNNPYAKYDVTVIDIFGRRL